MQDVVAQQSRVKDTTTNHAMFPEKGLEHIVLQELSDVSCMNAFNRSIHDCMRLTVVQAQGEALPV